MEDAGEHYLSDCIVPAVKFGGGGLMVLAVEDSLDASALDVLDNVLLPTLRQQFVEGPFLFLHGCAPVKTIINDYKYIETHLQEP